MFIKVNTAIIITVSVALFWLYKTETDIKSVSAVSYVFRDINRCELFHIVTQPDTVSSVRFTRFNYSFTHTVIY